MKKNNIAIILLLMIATTVATAQNSDRKVINRHPFSLGIAMGATSFDMTPADDNEHFMPGYRPELDLCYTYRFSSQWGLRIGLGLSYCQSTYKAEQITLSSTEFHPYPIDYSRTAAFVDERYHILQLELPLMALWQNNRFFAAFGVRGVLPIQQLGRYCYNNITSSAYIPQQGTSIANSNAMDCGLTREYRGETPESPLDGRFWIMGSAEIGYSFYSLGKTPSTVSLCVDYSFNSWNVSDDIVSSSPLVESDNGYPLRHHYGSLLSCGQVNPFHCLNVALRYSFSF